MNHIYIFAHSNGFTLLEFVIWRGTPIVAGLSFISAIWMLSGGSPQRRSVAVGLALFGLALGFAYWLMHWLGLY